MPQIHIQIENSYRLSVVGCQLKRFLVTDTRQIFAEKSLLKTIPLTTERFFRRKNRTDN